MPGHCSADSHHHPARPPVPSPAENEQEDFLLSSYDATCSLTPASARALLAGDAAAPMLFRARFLCMGHMPAVVEAGVAQERLRAAPGGSTPFAVFGGGCVLGCRSSGTCVGSATCTHNFALTAVAVSGWFSTVC